MPHVHGYHQPPPPPPPQAQGLAGVPPQLQVEGHAGNNANQAAPPIQGVQPLQQVQGHAVNQPAPPAQGVQPPAQGKLAIDMTLGEKTLLKYQPRP